MEWYLWLKYNHGINHNLESLRLVTFLGLRTSLFHKGIYPMEALRVWTRADSLRKSLEVWFLISGLWSYFLIVASFVRNPFVGDLDLDNILIGLHSINPLWNYYVYPYGCSFLCCSVLKESLMLTHVKIPL